MESSIVADAETLAKKFAVQDHEAASLATSVLPWLHHNNIWYQGYRASYKQVKDLETFLRQLPQSGYLMPVLPEDVRTDTGQNPREGVSEQVLGVILPTDDYADKVGTMSHLRQCAENESRCMNSTYSGALLRIKLLGRVQYHKAFSIELRCRVLTIFASNARLTLYPLKSWN